MIPNSDATGDSQFVLTDFDAVVFSDNGKPRGTARSAQLLAGIVVVLAHVGIWWLLQWSSRPKIPAENIDDSLLIEFVTRMSAMKILPPKTSSNDEKSRAQVKSQRRPEQIAQSAIALVPKTSMPSNSPPPLLYNDDGSVHIPEQVLTDLAKLRSDDRQFDFQQPGLERAAKLLRRREALEFRTTRFDKHWRPTQDMLTELLTKAVEKSTKEIKIPIPGDRQHHLTCRVSLLALGGGCGIESNGDPDALLPGHDDPETLSAAEDKACQAWWEKIIAAKTQDEWRSTRRLYEQECRKPLAREAPMPTTEMIKAPAGP